MLRFYLLISLLTVTFVIPSYAFSQSVYETPPETLVKLVDAPPIPAISISPDEQTVLLLKRPNVPGIEDLASPELKLAGLRFNPENFGPSRSSHYTGLSLRTIESEDERLVTGLPSNGRIRNLRWAPDSKHIAFTIDFADDIALYIANIEEAEARRILDLSINDVYSTSAISWMSDSRHLLARIIPADHGAPPTEPRIPSGPIIQEHDGDEAQARTYQDLLKNAHDEKVFEYYVTSQPVLIDIEKNKLTPLSEPGLITRISPSPNAQYIILQYLHKPFSYLVPAYRFPISKEVIDLEGNVVQEIADLPLAENIPTAFGSVRKGIRTVNWRSDQPATLYWVEAQDEGDARLQTDVRDEVFMQEAPFDKPPLSIAELELRYSSIWWSEDNMALISEGWWNTRQRRIYRFNPEKPSQKMDLVFDLSTEDRYSDPGRPVFETTKWGTSVMMTADKGRSIYMTGNGASQEGNRPFLRKVDLNSGEHETLFQSEEPYYEYPVRILSKRNGQVLTRRESTDTPPNYFLRNLKKDTLTPVTSFPHPYPELSGIDKQMLVYEREDGVQLNATLYTPSGYDAERDGPLPTLLWAYPREFKSADNAGQITDSPYRFKTISYWGALPYVTQGYAVLDRTSMPVIGEGDEEPNDTFVSQLVQNAEAAIQAGAETGAVDPKRVAIGGHSYGAFMTANLLAHSDLFRAGIARSGAYNRSLTPFGFQAEQRTFWDAPEIYFEMSPFMHAPKVNEPILLIHGEADNNSGTYTMQSIRYFNALKGHGKIARLVLLPYESHGYRARESLLHMLWETNNWLEKYVKPENKVVDPTG
ncbi:MAG: prolyl oligopeptidase family serine peptidase [Rhodothermaceae bacterium]|nr:prolyl oligopeptidase family serine peptidase [Rhodothermaceae bacterium]